MSDTLPVVAGSTFASLWHEDLTACLTNLRVEAGIDAVELMLSSPHLDANADVQRSAEDVLAALERSGIDRITSINPVDLNLISANDALAELSVEQYERAIELASLVGATTVVVVPGRMNTFCPMPYDVAMSRFRPRLDQLVGAAERKGTTLAIENSAFGFLETPSRIVDEILDRSEQTKLALALDFANAHFVGADLAREASHAAPHVAIVHVSDTTRQTWRHDYIGDGELEAFDIARMLHSVQFTGDVVYELAVDGVDWRRYAQDIGTLRAAFEAAS